MNNPIRQVDRVKDIEWFLDRIREDLSAIAFYGDGGTSQKASGDKPEDVDEKD
jgi:hypothetical protein